MILRNPKGTMKYWFEGASSSLIKQNINTDMGSQSYWYLGQPQGYIVVYKSPTPRAFAVLIGF